MSELDAQQLVIRVPDAEALPVSETEHAPELTSYGTTATTTGETKMVPIRRAPAHYTEVGPRRESPPVRAIFHLNNTGDPVIPERERRAVTLEDILSPVSTFLAGAVSMGIVWLLVEGLVTM